MASLVVTSCQDYILDKQPKNLITDATVWSDPTLIDAFLTMQYSLTTVMVQEAATYIPSWGVGSPVVGGVWDPNDLYPSEQGYGPLVINNIADEGKAGWAIVDVFGYKIGGLSVNGGLLEWWEYPYYIIRNLNQFIERVPNSPIDAALAKKRMAEARFLRAFNYFAMVKRYGGVPLITKQQKLDDPKDELYPARNSEREIYDFIISEMELSSSHLQDGLFLDLPFLYERAFLYSEIIDSYKNGKIKFIIPLKPFFGSKGVLALLKNSTKDFYLESILQSFIKASSLAFVRKYIPETFLIGKEAMKIISVEKIISGKRYVLKEAISSGMKGVYFSDEINFKETLEIACNAKMNWVLQEEVLNQPQTFSFFDNGASLCSAKDWFMRITTHYVNRNLADIIITARRDRAVHGAKDCLQIGTVID